MISGAEEMRLARILRAIHRMLPYREDPDAAMVLGILKNAGQDAQLNVEQQRQERGK
jgi:hypothetical protein